jgi:hypothetical protein
LSVRACDWLIAAFAGWTLLCHATVALGGGLRDLLRGALVLGFAAVLALGWRRWTAARRSTSTPEGTVQARGLRAAEGSTSLEARPARWVALGLSAALVAGFVWGRDLELWWWLCGAYLVGALLWVLRGEVRSGRAAEDATAATSPAREVAVWSMAVASALIALYAHTVSPDDGYFVNVAAHVVDFPDAPLLRHDTMHGKEGVPLMLSVYRLSSYELLGGAIAYLAGIPALHATQWALAALFSLFFPLAQSRLFRVLVPERWLPGTVVALLMLLFLQQTGQDYGSFSVWRMQQGKAAFLSIAVPLLIAHGVRFALRPTIRGWLWLATVEVAALGMTSTALWAAPVVGVLAVLSGAPLTRAGALRVVAGALASLYVILAGLALHGASYQELARLSSSTHGGVTLVNLSAKPIYDPEVLVVAAWTTVLGNGRYAAVALLATLSAWAFCMRPRSARLFLVFALGVWAFALNPYVAMAAAEQVTGGPSYWRVLWLLPVPAALAVLLSAFGRWPIPALRRVVRVPLLIGAALALFVVVPSHQVLLTPGRVQLGFGKLKMYPDGLAAATALRDHVPPRSTVVAPERLSHWIVTLQGHPYPLEVRRYYLELLGAHFPPAEIESRDRLTRYVGGARVANGLVLLQQGIQQYGLTGVAFSARHREGPMIRRMLASEGFARVYDDRRQEVWAKSAR